MPGYVERLSNLTRVRSASGEWCLRLAVFAVPYFLIVVLGHRTGVNETVPTFWLLGLGVALLLASIAAGVRGFYELWSYGHQAGLSSARGIALAVILLLPFLYQGVKAFTLPQLYDISTDLDDPPSFETALDDRGDAMNPVLDHTPESARLQIRSYPSVTARRYPLDIARVFKAVVNLIGDEGWTVLTSNTQQGQAPIDDEGSGLVAKPTANANGVPLRLPTPMFRPKNFTTSSSAPNPTPFESVQVSPTGRPDAAAGEDQVERYVEAVASSFLFGFESDVVIRMVEEDEGTLVDMRSTSRWGPHDLGSNAARIIDFMGELDTALQGLGQGS